MAAVFADAVKITIKIELAGKWRQVERRPLYLARKRIEIQRTKARRRRSHIIASIVWLGDEIVLRGDVEAGYWRLGKDQITEDRRAVTRRAAELDADLW